MPISRQKFNTVLSYFNIDESSGSELVEVVPACYFFVVEKFGKAGEPVFRWRSVVIDFTY